MRRLEKIGSVVAGVLAVVFVVGYAYLNFFNKLPPILANPDSVHEEVDNTKPNTAPIPVAKVPVSSDSMFIDLNKQRIMEHLPPLKSYANMDSVARQHADDMKSRGYYSHVTPEGITPGDRLAPVVGQGVNIGEIEDNLCAYSTPEGEIGRIEASPEHKSILSNPTFTVMGVGVAPSDADKCNGYLVVDFAQL